MKVILLQSIQGLGDKGEEKIVKSGYAQNYLFPNKLAVPAAQARIQGIQKRVAKKQVSDQEKQQLHKQLRGVSITLSGKVTQQGSLYVSVDHQNVLEALQKQGVKITQLTMKPAHIKNIGTHQVTVVVNNGIRATLAVIVNPET